MTPTELADLAARLEHCSANTKDEYLHELTGRAADALLAMQSRIAELEGLVRRAAINLSETAYPSWHEDARAALKEKTNG